MGRLEALPSQYILVVVAYWQEGTGEGVASCPPNVINLPFSGRP